MALLSIKTRQTYLKELGFYTGEVDGKVGPLTKQAYRNLQNKYFIRKKDLDGKYGNDTDILLRSAYNCKDLKYFKLEEFKCKCKGKYCTCYPVELQKSLVTNLDSMRKHYGKSTTIVSGLRCSKHNKAVGGTSSSRHKKGKACDIYVNGISSSKSGRIGIVDYWITTYSTARYAYCNGYGRTKSKKSYPTVSSMGNSTHVDVE